MWNVGDSVVIKEMTGFWQAHADIGDISVKKLKTPKDKTPTEVGSQEGIKHTPESSETAVTNSDPDAEAKAKDAERKRNSRASKKSA